MLRPCLLLGTPGTRYQIPGTRFQVPGTWCTCLTWRTVPLLLLRSLPSRFRVPFPIRVFPATTLHLLLAPLANMSELHRYTKFDSISSTCIPKTLAGLSEKHVPLWLKLFTSCFQTFALRQNPPSAHLIIYSSSWSQDWPQTTLFPPAPLVFFYHWFGSGIDLKIMNDGLLAIADCEELYLAVKHCRASFSRAIMEPQSPIKINSLFVP